MSFLLSSAVLNLSRLTKSRPPQPDLFPLWEKAVRVKGDRNIEWTDQALDVASAFYSLIVRLLLWDYITFGTENEHVVWLFPKLRSDMLHEIAMSSKFKNYAVHILVDVISNGKIASRPHVELIREDIYPEARQIAEAPERIMYEFPWVDAAYNPWKKSINDITQKGSPAKEIWLHSIAFFSEQAVVRLGIYYLFLIFDIEEVKILYKEIMKYTMKPEDPEADIQSFTANVPYFMENTIFYNENNPGERDFVMRLIAKFTFVVLFHISNITRVMIIGFTYSAENMFAFSEAVATKERDRLFLDVLGEFVTDTPADNYSAIVSAGKETGVFVNENLITMLDEDKQFVEKVSPGPSVIADVQERVESIRDHAKDLMHLWPRFEGRLDDVVFSTYQLRLLLTRVFEKGFTGGVSTQVAGSHTAAAFHERITQGHTGLDYGTQYISLPSTLVIKIHMTSIDLNQNQSSPQLMIWPSHGLSKLVQQIEIKEDESGNSSASDFVKRMKMSGAIVTEPITTHKTITVHIQLERGHDRVRKDIYERAIIGFAMYVHQKDSEDAVPLIRRRGITFAPFKQLTSVQRKGKYLGLTLWEGPIDSDFTIDTETFRTQTPMKYISTGTLSVVVSNLPGTIITEVTDTTVSERVNIGAKKPLPLIKGEKYEKDLNRVVLQALKVYSRARDSPAYHSIMYLLWPGTPTFRFIGLEVFPTPHTLGFYETLLRHQLWRDNIADDEFVRIHQMAYSETHRYRVFAHERFWWVVTMAFTFVNITMYKLDILEGKSVEIMENATISMTSDCEDDSTSLYPFMKNLEKLPLSTWEPLRLVQLILRHMEPFQLVMTTSAASLASVGTAGPILHSTSILMPPWVVFSDRGSDVPSHVKTIEKPRILEGTGIFAGWLMSVSNCFADGKIPGSIFDSIEKYNAIRKSLIRDSPFDAPTVGDLGVRASPYKLAEEHPFFGYCVSICGTQLGGGDKLLVFQSEESTGVTEKEHNFPHFSKVMSNSTDQYKFVGGPGENIDVSEYTYLAQYFPPPPIFDGRDIPLSNEDKSKLRPLPLHQVEITPAREQQKPNETDPDLDLIRFRACTVFMNAKSSADPAGVMHRKLAMFMESPLIRGSKSVDWKVVQFMHGVVQYEIRITY